MFEVTMRKIEKLAKSAASDVQLGIRDDELNRPQIEDGYVFSALICDPATEPFLRESFADSGIGLAVKPNGADAGGSANTWKLHHQGRLIGFYNETPGELNTSEAEHDARKIAHILYTEAFEALRAARRSA